MTDHKKIIELLINAYLTARTASLQGHKSHWDMKGTGGQNCPECIRARKLRGKAERYYDQALELINPTGKEES